MTSLLPSSFLLPSSLSKIDSDVIYLQLFFFIWTLTGMLDTISAKCEIFQMFHVQFYLTSMISWDQGPTVRPQGKNCHVTNGQGASWTTYRKLCKNFFHISIRPSALNELPHAMLTISLLRQKVLLSLFTVDATKAWEIK